MGIGNLQIQSPAIQPEPDTTNQRAKDQLYQLALPCDVQLVGRSSRDEEAYTAPELPSVDPEGQAFDLPHGQWKITCVTFFFPDLLQQM